MQNKKVYYISALEFKLGGQFTNMYFLYRVLPLKYQQIVSKLIIAKACIFFKFTTMSLLPTWLRLPLFLLPLV